MQLARRRCGGGRRSGCGSGSSGGSLRSRLGLFGSARGRRSRRPALRPARGHEAGGQQSRQEYGRRSQAGDCADRAAYQPFLRAAAAQVCLGRSAWHHAVQYAAAKRWLRDSRLVMPAECRPLPCSRRACRDADRTVVFRQEPWGGGAHGQELWQSDGTAAGTRLVQDIWTGPGGAYPDLRAGAPEHHRRAARAALLLTTGLNLC